jgi:hypothetical protein
MFGGQLKIPSLVALGMFHGWWPMESSKLSGQLKVLSLVALEMNPMFGGQWGSILLGGQWKVPSLVAFGLFHVWFPLEGKGKTSFSPPSTFHLMKFYLNFFPLILRIFFTMVLDHCFSFSLFSLGL